MYNLLWEKDVWGAAREYVAEVVSSLTELFQPQLDKAYRSGKKMG
jgi:hypothetical protein